MKLKKSLLFFSGIALLTPALAIASTSCNGSNNSPTKYTIKIIEPKFTNQIYYVNEKYNFEALKVKSSEPNHNPQVNWTTDNDSISINSKGVLTFFPKQEGLVKVKIIATAKTDPTISDSIELRFNVFDKKKGVAKEFDGKYLGSSTGNFTLVINNNDPNNCTLVSSKNLNVQHLDFGKCSVFEHNGVKYQIVEIGSNALNLENTQKITFAKTINRINQEAIFSPNVFEIEFLHEDLEHVEIHDEAFHDCNFSTIDFSKLTNNFIPSFAKKISVDRLNHFIVSEANYDIWKETLPAHNKEDEIIGLKKWVPANDFCETATGSLLIGYLDRYCSAKDCYVIAGRSWDFHSPDGIAFTQENLNKSLPDTKIEGIAQRVFRKCYEHLSGTFEIDGSLINNIGYRAFERSNIQIFKINSESKIDTVGWSAFLHCEYLEKFIVWTSTIKIIDAFAFKCCYKFNSFISMGSGSEQSCFWDFRQIRQYAFEATMLTDENLFYIEELWPGVFKDCKSLTFFSITSDKHTAKEIPEGFFENCENLEEVNLGEKVESIGEDCFKNCNKLQKLTLRNSHAPVSIPTNAKIFTDVLIVPYIYVPEYVFAAYLRTIWGLYYRYNLRKIQNSYGIYPKDKINLI